MVTNTPALGITHGWRVGSRGNVAFCCCLCWCTTIGAGHHSILKISHPSSWKGVDPSLPTPSPEHPLSLLPLCLPMWTNWTSGPLIRRKQMWTCPRAFSLLSGRFQGSLHTPAISSVSSKAFDLLMPIRGRSKIKVIFLEQQGLCIFYAGTEMNMSHHRDQGQNASPWSELFLCQLCSGSVGKWCLKVCPAYTFADSAICVHGIVG